MEAVSLPPQGDDDLLLAEYLRRRGNIVRFLAARAGSMAAAEDLAQELYLKLATRDRAAEIGNPSALLYRMAINLMLDRARGESRMAARDGAWRQVSGSELGGIVRREAHLVAVDAEDFEILEIHLVHGAELLLELRLGAVKVRVVHLHGAHAHEAEKLAALLVAVARPVFREAKR